MYAVAFVFNMASLLLTNYVVQLLGPNIEQTPARRLIFQITQGNFFTSWAPNILISIVLIFGMYVVLRRVNTVVWSAGGIILLLTSLFDFVNDSSLLGAPFDPVAYVLFPAILLIAAWTATLLLNRWKTRTEPRTAVSHSTDDPRTGG
jgi:hypothetical protein